MKLLFVSVLPYKSVCNLPELVTIASLFTFSSELFFVLVSSSHQEHHGPTQSSSAFDGAESATRPNNGGRPSSLVRTGRARTSLQVLQGKRRADRAVHQPPAAQQWHRRVSGASVLCVRTVRGDRRPGAHSLVLPAQAEELPECYRLQAHSIQCRRHSTQVRKMCGQGHRPERRLLNICSLFRLLRRLSYIAFTDNKMITY